MENKNILRLSPIKAGFYNFESGRDYYKDEKDRIFVSMDADRFTDKKYIQKGGKVFYNANNKIGEPEYALRKNQYKIIIENGSKKQESQDAEELNKYFGVTE